MAYLRRHGYAAKGRDVLLKEGSPSPKEHEYGTRILHIARGDKLMEEFVSVEDVKSVQGVL